MGRIMDLLRRQSSLICTVHEQGIPMTMECFLERKWESQVSSVQSLEVAQDNYDKKVVCVGIGMNQQLCLVIMFGSFVVGE